MMWPMETARVDLHPSARLFDLYFISLGDFWSLEGKLSPFDLVIFLLSAKL